MSDMIFAMNFIGILLVISTTILQACAELPSIFVQTKLGIIKGLVEEVENVSIFEFRAIPYAKPPVGKFRFRKSELLDSRNETFDATKFGPACVQNINYNSVFPIQNKVISEDCLTLNIYVPRNLSPKLKRSTMIWIHGGGFYQNQGSMYDGTYIALYGDVIVVTINYRLGVFGFLSTGTKHLPGNRGLWDQHLAIMWVKTHIESFGGDPESITLFGNSAAGASVSLQSLIPKNENSIKRVIAQSGMANAYITMSHNPLYYVKLMGKKLGCTVDNGSTNLETLVNCINKTSADSILSAQESIPWHRGDRVRFELLFGAVVDNELPKPPADILHDKNSLSFEKFRNTDFLVGTTDTDGSMFYHLFKNLLSQKYNCNLSDGIPANIVCDFIIPGIVTDLYPNCLYKRAIERAICQKYRHADPGVQAKKMLDLYGDIFFIVPSIEWLHSHSINNAKSTTYHYVFTVESSNGVSEQYPTWLKGAQHMAELPFLFGMSHLNSGNFHISKEIIKLWTNFAKNGNPNDGDVQLWKQFTPEGREYYNMSLQSTSDAHLFKSRVSFWIREIPKIKALSCHHEEL